MDHFGLASRIIAESDAHTVAHQDATDRLSDPIEHFKREQRVFRPFLHTMGVPEQVVATAITLLEAYTDYQDPSQSIANSPTATQSTREGN